MSLQSSQRLVWLASAITYYQLQTETVVPPGSISPHTVSPLRYQLELILDLISKLTTLWHCAHESYWRARENAMAFLNHSSQVCQLQQVFVLEIGIGLEIRSDLVHELIKDMSVLRSQQLIEQPCQESGRGLRASDYEKRAVNDDLIQIKLLFILLPHKIIEEILVLIVCLLDTLEDLFLAVS